MGNSVQLNLALDILSKSLRGFGALELSAVKDYVPTEDDVVVERLKAAGAVILGNGESLRLFAKAGAVVPRPRLRSQTTMSMTAPTQGCRTSSFGLRRVSRRSRSDPIGRSVSIGATVRTVPHSVAACSVPVPGERPALVPRVTNQRAVTAACARARRR